MKGLELALLLVLGLSGPWAHAQRVVCVSRAPGAPLNLKANASGPSILVSWDRPAGQACIRNYVVEWLGPNGDPSSLTTPSVSANITVLPNSNITVKAMGVPVGRSSNEGGVASIRAPQVAPPSSQDKPGWKCEGNQTYAVCEAAELGLCKPLTCKQLAAQGLCAQHFMRSMNWAAKSMVQHCAKECGCDATPALRKTMELPKPDWCCGFSVGNYFVQDPFSREI